MKGLINFESIWRRSLRAMGVYNQWLFYREKKMPNLTMMKMRKLYGQFIHEGALCFDIGANVGSRTGCFLMLKSRVIAVEPQHKCIIELEKVFNGHPVTILEKGVGAKQEVKDFYVASNSLISSFSVPWIEGMKNRHKKDNWDTVVQVEVITLDMLIRDYGMPDFIKIDTEGFEEEVLKGLSTPVKNLSFEYTLPDPQNKAIACINLTEEIYQGRATYNVSRDEAYSMHFKEPVSGEVLKKLISSTDFNLKNFGGYGDIYVIN
ncbi:MAG: FkbM family methyltransferase [Chitinophagaceae bacterium]